MIGQAEARKRWREYCRLMEARVGPGWRDVVVNGWRLGDGWMELGLHEDPGAPKRPASYGLYQINDVWSRPAAMPLHPSMLLFLPEWRAALARAAPLLLRVLIAQSPYVYVQNVLALYCYAIALRLRVTTPNVVVHVLRPDENALVAAELYRKRGRSVW